MRAKDVGGDDDDGNQKWVVQVVLAVMVVVTQVSDGNGERKKYINM